MGGTLYGTQKLADTVQQDLAFEVGPYQHDNISVLNFAHRMWGLDLEIGRQILAMKLPLDHDKVEEYYRKPKENDLHGPFKDFAAFLLNGVVSNLEALNGSAQAPTDAFWDTKGEQEIKHDGRSRKLDLAILWKSQMPPSDDVVPQWTVVKHPVEMKHDSYKKKGPILPALPAKTKARMKQGWNTATAGDATHKRKTDRSF